jgi:hypothetical protein
MHRAVARCISLGGAKCRGSGKRIRVRLVLQRRCTRVGEKRGLQALSLSEACGAPCRSLLANCVFGRGTVVTRVEVFGLQTPPLLRPLNPLCLQPLNQGGATCAHAGDGTAMKADADRTQNLFKDQTVTAEA